jgi:hypothetical protein
MNERGEPNIPAAGSASPSARRDMTTDASACRSAERADASVVTGESAWRCAFTRDANVATRAPAAPRSEGAPLMSGASGRRRAFHAGRRSRKRGCARGRSGGGPLARGRFARCRRGPRRRLCGRRSLGSNTGLTPGRSRSPR